MKKSLVLFVLLMTACAGLFAQTSAGAGIRILPSTYLRGYDPVTVYFPTDTGPAAGGVLDEPGELFRITPAHPGEYRWADARTLQFLPAAAWPPLRRYEIAVRTQRFSLATFMVPPASISPGNGQTNLEPVRTLTLVFAEELSASDLADMLTLEVRPLPGIGEGGTIWLTKNDFAVRALDRGSSTERAGYLVTFNTPIAYGRAVVVNLRLSLDAAIVGSVASYSFSTRPEFRLVAMGSNRVAYPVAANGSVYSQSQAIDCGAGSEPVYLEFSEDLGALSLEVVRNLVRFEPAVTNFRHEVSGRRINLYFSAERGASYRLSLRHQALTSRTGRILEAFGETSFYFYYERVEAFLRWNAAAGIVERYGPQYFPMEGRGTDRVDLRIHRIDPMDRNLWPFPTSAVTVDESSRPPMPGEEEDATSIAQRIRLLGSPQISEIVPLPITNSSPSSRFGINLGPYLARIAGASAPGTYLVGYRMLGPTNNRLYVRMTVTDLCLSTIEEEHGLVFVVTSVGTGLPVAGAAILVEADAPTGNAWVPVIQGTTDRDGRFRYNHTARIQRTIRRISVTYQSDVLVLDPANPPPVFANSHWSSGGRWLGWLSNDPVTTSESSRNLGYIMTERPLYRTEETVHILGWARQRRQGQIIAADASLTRNIVINGPGVRERRLPVTLDSFGQFTADFSDQNLPTGEYSVALAEGTNQTVVARATFQMESYRIPTFEVLLDAPDRAPMDDSFVVDLTAGYYAGGRVLSQPVVWNISRYRYTFSLPDYPGFSFSSYEGISGRTPTYPDASRRTGTTDANGGARITVNPAAAGVSEASRYVIEAMVTDADGQSVTTTDQVIALPPFVVGLKTDRFVEEGNVIRPQVVVIGTDERPVAGKDFVVRIYQRQWHSYLAESDFVTGEARYLSDVVDTLVSENRYVSTAEPMQLQYPVTESGVYVVEVLARDNVGRLQTVRADLYIPGATPVAWRRTEANLFETRLDRREYAPGDTATLLLQSPFQTAQALIIVEAPTGNQYSWVEIRNGQGLFRLPVEATMTPRVPVHALLMRGRLPNTGESLDGRIDRGRPIAMANTTYVVVTPVANRLNVTLEHPAQALPGSRQTIRIRVTDRDGRPVTGQAAIWLVDRAVLALRTERTIDPLSGFIDPVNSRLSLRDTRNQIIGNLAVEENAGGGAGGVEGARSSADEDRMTSSPSAATGRALLERTTVRRNFQTVPLFSAQVRIANGVGEVTVDLPDNLTDFAVRCVAVSGYEKFGVAGSVIAIRLPVIVQSSLPRFVRPGDSFEAGGTGRVVEGEGGAGSAQIQVEGLTVNGRETTATRTLTLVRGEAQPLFFPIGVPANRREGETVQVRVAVERNADRANDAFETTLPVRDAARRVFLETLVQPAVNADTLFPQAQHPVRTGSLRQAVTISADRYLIELLNGIELLRSRPADSAGQWVGALYPSLMLQNMLNALGSDRDYSVPAAELASFLLYIDSTRRSNGLYAYWPGGQGCVSLTSSVLELLLAARTAGFTVAADRLAQTANILRGALRSDYQYFISGYSYEERVDALIALAHYGSFEEGYAEDLLSGALAQSLYGQARIAGLYLERNLGARSGVQAVLANLRQKCVYRLENGVEVFAGLNIQDPRWGGLTLSSEMRTIAAVAVTLFRAEPANARINLVVDEIIRRGRNSGWRNAADSSSVMATLGEILRDRPRTAVRDTYSLRFGSNTTRLELGGRPILYLSSDSADRGGLTHLTGAAGAQPWTLLQTSYVPSTLGGDMQARASGFVVNRELQLIADNRVASRLAPAAGQELAVPEQTVVEEHVTVVVSDPRDFVAVRIPIACGFEIMNPALQTSGAEATPIGRNTVAPTSVRMADDGVTYFFERLPAGTYHFYFRERAVFQGIFQMPPASAEMLYDPEVSGNSPGSRVRIAAR